MSPNLLPQRLELLAWQSEDFPWKVSIAAIHVTQKYIAAGRIEGRGKFVARVMIDTMKCNYKCRQEYASKPMLRNSQTCGLKLMQMFVFPE